MYAIAYRTILNTKDNFRNQNHKRQYGYINYIACRAASKAFSNIYQTLLSLE